MEAEQHNSIDPGAEIGHVHLKVAELDRALDFYCGVLGFDLQQRVGDEAAPPPGVLGFVIDFLLFMVWTLLASIFMVRALGDSGGAAASTEAA
jgi:catechol 2,3-dioxygenase-like lactoylglutathione lyase family enzyme